MKEALDRLRQTLEDDGQYQAKLDYSTAPHPDTLQMDILVRVTAGPRARIGALPMTAEGKPPPVPHTRVVTPAGEHPLLEFTHPALAIVGLAFWAMFTFVHYRPMAWIALAVLLVTIGMGLAWLARSGRAQQTQAPVDACGAHDRFRVEAAAVVFDDGDHLVGGTPQDEAHPLGVGVL